MEQELHVRFVVLWKEGTAVGQRWFIRKGKKIFEDFYTDQISINEHDKKIYACQFSVGWFEGLRRRWRMSLRVKTKVSQKTPEEKIPAVQRFLQEIRRKSQPSDVLSSQ